MNDKMTAEYKIERIKEALHDCQSGKLSFVAFAMVVGLYVEPIKLTEADFEWARKTQLKIQASGTIPHPADAADSAAQLC